jgi:hypothetical protein
MRVVEFRGAPVKRQRKINADQLLLTFYDRPPQVVTVEEWATCTNNKYYSGDVRRCDVVRNRSSKKKKAGKNHGHNRNAAASAR